MNQQIPRIGEELYHVEAGWVSVAVVRHYPVVYAEVISAQTGRRFSALQSALYRDETLYGDKEVD